MKGDKMSNYLSIDLVPCWDLDIEQKMTIRNSVRNALIDRAVREQCATPDKFISRPLLSRDLGLLSWKTPELKKGAVWVDGALGDRKCVVIYKITQLSPNPKVHEIRMTVSGATVFICELDNLYCIIPIIKEMKRLEIEQIVFQIGNVENLRMEGYLPTAITIPMNATYKIEISSVDDGPGDEIILGGYVVEPRGYTIA